MMVTSVIVPKTGGLYTTKVTVIAWLKNEGQRVEKGESLVTLETEKVTYELPAPASGVLLKILVPEGSDAYVGQPIGYIGEPGEKLPVD